MKKAIPTRLVSLVFAILFAVVMLSACAKKERLPEIHTYNPGAAFVSNISNEDIRKVVKCSVIFEVIDETARTELSMYNSTVRNAVLAVLGEFTLEELTVGRDLNEISQRIVQHVNEALESSEELVIGAKFTEFALS